MEINTDTHVKQFPNEALYTMYNICLFLSLFYTFFLNKTNTLHAEYPEKEGRTKQMNSRDCALK